MVKVEPEVELDYMDDGEDMPPALTPNGSAVENGFDPGKFDLWLSFVWLWRFDKFRF